MRRAAIALVVGLASSLGMAATHAADAPQIERGRAAFEHRCAMCHRAGGTGSNLLARRIGKEQSILEQRTDLQPEYVRHVVRWGYVNMPRISRVELADAELDAVIAYLTARAR